MSKKFYCPKKKTFLLATGQVVSLDKLWEENFQTTNSNVSSQKITSPVISNDADASVVVSIDSKSWLKQRSEAFWIFALSLIVVAILVFAGYDFNRLYLIYTDSPPKPELPVQTLAVPMNKPPNKPSSDSGVQRYPFVYSGGDQLRKVISPFRYKTADGRLFDVVPGDDMYILDMNQGKYGFAIIRNNEEIVSGVLPLQAIEERTR